MRAIVSLRLFGDRLFRQAYKADSCVVREHQERNRLLDNRVQGFAIL